MTPQMTSTTVLRSRSRKQTPVIGVILKHAHLNDSVEFDSQMKLLHEVPPKKKDKLLAARELDGNLTISTRKSNLNRNSGELIDTQEMERKRIASDLHDSIGQSLSTMSCGIATAIESSRCGNIKTMNDVLDTLAVQVKQAILEVQRIAMDLRPAILDDLGLVATLTWFFREFRLIHAEISLTTDISLLESDIPAELLTHIFRLVQEAANNTVKHARASKLSIHLRRSNDSIHLEIVDNGIGFKMSDVDHALAMGCGIGLRSMSERAEYSGGRLCLLSQPGQGTRIVASWPVGSGH
jgi:signal transduction histidine kinase